MFGQNHILGTFLVILLIKIFGEKNVIFVGFFLLNKIISYCQDLLSRFSLLQNIFFFWLSP
jgi:hypothetical protein